MPYKAAVKQAAAGLSGRTAGPDSGLYYLPIVVTSSPNHFIILEDSLSAEEYGVGFKKGNTELRDKVQATLEEMAADGTLKSVSEKWYGEDVHTIGT